MSTARNKHPFHLVDLSPWPILTCAALVFLTTGLVMHLHKHMFGNALLAIGVCGVFFTLYSWWRDVVQEGIVGGHHTSEVRHGLRIGMALFITSEVMFFVVFFWSFFKAKFFPVAVLDGVWVIKEGIWPPAGIVTFDPWDIPFINTLILLLSGTTVTWAHYAIRDNNQKDSVLALGITILLGLTFTCVQAYEYHHAQFKITDGIYPTNFYLATGFHGVHVIIGTIFLIVCYFRAKKGQFAGTNGHLGFEFAAWYWHFVDVVWLFLFVFIYVLGRY